MMEALHIAETHVSVIIASAGSGKRMGGGVPKQYRMCENLPVLVRAVKAFCGLTDVESIVVVTAPGDEAHCRSLLESYGVTKLAAVVGGGNERQDSVYEAVKALPCQTTHVLIHDGARPFVTEAVIRNVLKALETERAVIPCVTPKDTIRGSGVTLKRETLQSVQTPQGFRVDVLKQAFEAAYRDGFYGTDDAGLVERLGVPVATVDGDYGNIKITTKDDMPSSVRTGMGYDVHRLVDGRPLMLACVNVPYSKGLLGHSDADVVSHAIADALLGAAALGDIGEHFPDKDPLYKDMAGSVLLERTRRLLDEAGFTIVNIDATLVAENPKIGPYKEAMRMAVAAALSMDSEFVNIKATTEEGLGITGDGSAMSAMAVVTIK